MIELGYNGIHLQEGIKTPVYWDKLAEHMNLLILGNSGSGKSTFLNVLIFRVVTAVPDAKIWYCDYKNSMRDVLNRCAMYWGYQNVWDGISDFEREFENRLSTGQTNSFRGWLVIDEYVSLLASLEKKDMAELQRKIAKFAFMSRSLGLGLILATQRGLAEHFAYGCRDSMNVILLGSPSKESIRSFASAEDAEQMIPCPQSSGYAIFDGKPIQMISTPRVLDFSKLNQAVRKAVEN